MGVLFSSLFSSISYFLLFSSYQVSESEDGTTYEVTLEGGGDLQIATVLPYTRRHLEKLMAEMSENPDVRQYTLEADNRIVPVFEFGDDSADKPVHYLICGEDGWETSGMWFGDSMIRALANDKELRYQLTDQALLRIVPLISPYTLSRNPGLTYIDAAGQNIYAAAMWGDLNPPTEIRLLRQEVETLIASGRLGFMSTIHSWGAMRQEHGFETIREAGGNSLSEARAEWARTVVEQIVKDIPKGSGKVADKIWKGGLARDYLLANHNTITFRLEVSAYRGDLDAIRDAALQFLRNLSELSDWSPVLDF